MPAKLDRSRSYQEFFPAGKYAYEQDGKKFKQDGTEYVEPSAARASEPIAEITTVSVSNPDEPLEVRIGNAAEADDPFADIPDDPPPPPKKKRGRPRKTTR